MSIYVQVFYFHKVVAINSSIVRTSKVLVCKFCIKIADILVATKRPFIILWFSAKLMLYV